MEKQTWLRMNHLMILTIIGCIKPHSSRNLQVVNLTLIQSKAQKEVMIVCQRVVSHLHHHRKSLIKLLQLKRLRQDQSKFPKLRVLDLGRIIQVCKSTVTNHQADLHIYLKLSLQLQKILKL